MDQSMVAAATDAGRKVRLPAFREGLLAPWEGFRFMNRNPRLWQFGILPVFLNLLITVLVLALLISGGVWYAQTMHPRFAASWWQRGLEVLVILALFVGIVAIALAVWLLLQSILCGYFYGKLARQVELQLGMRPEDMKEVSFAREVLDGIRDVTVLLAVNAALLLLHIIPVVGSVVAVAGSLYFDSWVLGLDYFEYPLGLRGKTRREMRQFCKAHRPQTLGLGAAVLLLALLPVISAVFLTTAATGAVLLHRRLSVAPAGR
jgi:CysZ protein